MKHSTSSIRSFVAEPIRLQMTESPCDRASSDVPHSAPRIALYSHDTQGLGHMRRQLLIASALLRMNPRPTLLMICGAKEVGAFELPPGVDCLILPSVSKVGSGAYEPRRLDMSLTDLTSIRANTICAAMESFDPDLVLVDKVPTGFQGELLPSLRWLKARGRARCILGLREVLDDPDAARRDWERDACDDAVADHYAQVWVYGDRGVYDPVAEYGFAACTASLTRFTGYLNPLDLDRIKEVGGAHEEDEDAVIAEVCPVGKRLVLCAVGGGQDGAELALSFARASLPSDVVGLIVTGPYMPAGVRSELRAISMGRADLEVREFVTEPYRLMRRADAIVAMGGYNTVCEVLAFGKPSLIVPRVHPRREQLVRAQSLSRLGLVDVLTPDLLNSASIGAWVARARGPERPAADMLDFAGVDRLTEFAGQALVRTGKGAAHAAG